MPIVEFRCQACRRRFSVLIRTLSEAVCPHCQAQEVERLVSRFGRLRSEDGRLEEVADEMDFYGEPDSPAAMRSALREAGKAMDEDMADEMEAMFEEDMEGTSLPEDDVL